MMLESLRMKANCSVITTISSAARSLGTYSGPTQSEMNDSWHDEVGGARRSWRAAR